MSEEIKNESSQELEQKTKEESAQELDTGQENIEKLKNSLAELNDKYIRLYADFENYKKITARNKEELLKYANEELMSDLLTVIDHLELALQHASGNESSSALAEGVDLTLKELKNVLEKHGLATIEALGKPFDPSVHHAISQIETEEAEENTVVKEFRKGYMLRDRVLRAALVGVAKKQTQSEKAEPEETQKQETSTHEQETK
jgi:molecular chaperone GrpE